MYEKFSPYHYSVASALFEIDRRKSKLKLYQKNGLATSPDDYLRKAWNILKKESHEH